MIILTNQNASNDSRGKGSTHVCISAIPRDILELLISEVQAYPILWNKAASEYKETQKKRLLWAEIANRLNVTVDFAKTK